MALDQLQELENLYDTQIAVHTAEVRRLNEKRNADCSKTRKLHAEILTNIFGILQHSFESKDLWADTLSGWVKVTHVCRTWRAIALNEPTLWTDLAGAPRNWALEVFARSKAAPLRLRLGGPISGHHIQINDAVVASTPERIKYLDIYGSDIDRLIKPTPFLESLTLHDLDEFDEFPFNFLGGFAPRLRSVHCEGTVRMPYTGATWLANMSRLECKSMHFGASWVLQLTTLKLLRGWVALDGAEYVSFNALLSALENLPSLQCLSLAQPKSFDDTPCTRATPVHIRHLQDITIIMGNEFGRSMVQILDYLVVDRIRRLDITFLDIERVPAAVCHFFQTFYDGPDLPVLRWTGPTDIEFSSSANPFIASVLTFRSFRPAFLTSCLRLLPQCKPLILDANMPAQVHTLPELIWQLIEIPTIEELRLAMSPVTLETLLSLPQKGPAPYFPFIRRLHLERAVDRHSLNLLWTLQKWISARQSMEHVVIKSYNGAPENIQYGGAVTVTVLS